MNDFNHPLVSPAGIRERLSAFGLAPNKALGQNFLADNSALSALLDALPGDRLPVLEIGPGLGALTGGLLDRSNRVVAVEKDAAMAAALQSLTPEERLTVVEADFLKADLNELHALLGGGEFVVAGNLPYYITTPCVLKLLSSGLPMRALLLMLQQEAAERFFALPGDRVYGPLTVLAACGYKAEEVLRLSPAAYYPQPDVHSAVVLLTQTAAAPPVGFLTFLQAAFAMRRKTLVN
ncbi:MAG: 16S rRNA (adenine(1518)-N(6)/adenine(1519)-N(6))-dimethyltransferase RsmA, partial [Bacillota bacterium]